MGGQERQRQREKYSYGLTFLRHSVLQSFSIDQNVTYYLSNQNQHQLIFVSGAFFLKNYFSIYSFYLLNIPRYLKPIYFLMVGL